MAYFKSILTTFLFLFCSHLVYGQVIKYEIVMTPRFMQNSILGLLVVSDLEGNIVWTQEFEEGNRTKNLNFEFFAGNHPMMLSAFSRSKDTIYYNLNTYDDYRSLAYSITEIGQKTILDEVVEYERRPYDYRSSTQRSYVYTADRLPELKSRRSFNEFLSFADAKDRINLSKRKVSITGIEDLHEYYIYSLPWNGIANKFVWKDKLTLRYEHNDNDDFFTTIIANDDREFKYIYLEKYDLGEDSEFNLEDLGQELEPVHFNFPEKDLATDFLDVRNLVTGNVCGRYFVASDFRDNEFDLLLPTNEYLFEYSTWFYNNVPTDRGKISTHFYHYKSEQPLDIQPIRNIDYNFTILNRWKNGIEIRCLSKDKKMRLNLFPVWNEGYYPRFLWIVDHNGPGDLRFIKPELDRDVFQRFGYIFLIQSIPITTIIIYDDNHQVSKGVIYSPY